MENIRMLVYVFSTLLLTSCGGSGGDTSETAADRLGKVEPLGNNNFQYLGVIDTSISDSFLTHFIEFVQVSESFTTETVVQFFEDPLDACTLTDQFIENAEYDLELEPSPYDGFLGVFPIHTDSNNILANTNMTEISAGDITFNSTGEFIGTVSPNDPTSQYIYTNWVIETAPEVSWVGKTVSADIAGDIFPPYANVELQTPIDVNVIDVKNPTGPNTTMSFTWEPGNISPLNDSLSFVKIGFGRTNLVIRCTVVDDGYFEVPESVNKSIEIASELAYNHYLQGTFTYGMSRELLKLHSSGDSLLITRSE